MTTMPLDRIEEQHNAMPGVSMSQYVVGAAVRQGTRVPPQDSFVGDISAELYRGLWIVRCAECSGSCAVTSVTPVYMCPDCGDGWFHVIFPKNKTKIETEVLKRPNIRGRLFFANWLPIGLDGKPESLEKLRKETIVLKGMDAAKLMQQRGELTIAEPVE